MFSLFAFRYVLLFATLQHLFSSVCQQQNISDKPRWAVAIYCIQEVYVYDCVVVKKRDWDRNTHTHRTTWVTRRGPAVSCFKFQSSFHHVQPFPTPVFFWGGDTTGVRHFVESDGVGELGEVGEAEVRLEPWISQFASDSYPNKGAVFDHLLKIDGTWWYQLQGRWANQEKMASSAPLKTWLKKTWVQKQASTKTGRFQGQPVLQPWFEPETHPFLVGACDHEPLGCSTSSFFCFNFGVKSSHEVLQLGLSLIHL